MSGHSKWAQTKHKKAAADEKRGKVFSKLGKLITLSVRDKGPNPETNPQLRAAIEKARAANMPKDTIERAVSTGSRVDAAELVSVLYEAYGPGGAALMITGVTDNNNRTSAEVRKILADFGAKMAPGGALWLFEKSAAGWRARTPTPLVDPGEAERLQKLTAALLEQDDIQEVYSNAA